MTVSDRSDPGQRLGLVVESHTVPCSQPIGTIARPSWLRRWAALGLIVLLLAVDRIAPAATSLVRLVPSVQPKVVKIYGAGGLRRLEAYQTGLLISGSGHVLTLWTYVLDADPITVLLSDGRRYEAELVGADPVREIAVLKIDGTDLAHFDLAATNDGRPGDPVLVFANPFGVATGNEWVSVLHGWISARTTLKAQIGAHESPYRGPIWVVDAITSNPGAGGGAVTDRDGRLLGMVGRELQDTASKIWLNYVLPLGPVAESVEAIIEGRQTPDPARDDDQPDQPVRLDDLGIGLVPDVVPHTPPFIDWVASGSSAARTGLLPDDLVVFINGQLVRSCRQLRKRLTQLPASRPVRITVLRGRQLIERNVTAGAN